MNLKERLLKALRGEPVDRVPVAALATGITVRMQEHIGVFWPEAHGDVDKLARVAESIHFCTETECIKLPFDMAVEVEALGADVDYRTRDTVPTEKHHLYSHPDELTVPENFFDRARVPVVLKAVSQLRKKYDNEIAIVTSIVGPFSLAEKLFGFDNFLIWVLTNPDWVHQAMKALTPLAIRYSQAQIQAGTDAIIIGEAGCSGGLISPNTYRDFILPYHRELCAALTVPSIMHICGKSTKHTQHIAETGTSVYNFDDGVDAAVARKNLAGKVGLTGYIPTVNVLLNGTPDDVYASARECLANGVQVLTPGCAMAPHTPLENIHAMVRAAHEWKQ